MTPIIVRTTQKNKKIKKIKRETLRKRMDTMSIHPFLIHRKFRPMN